VSQNGFVPKYTCITYATSLCFIIHYFMFLVTHPSVAETGTCLGSARDTRTCATELAKFIPTLLLSEFFPVWGRNKYDKHLPGSNENCTASTLRSGHNRLFHCMLFPS
jgi:hypothetical protein